MTDQRIELPKDARLAVLGSPIEHSKSPAIHAAAYRELGLDWQYGRQELQAAQLRDFLAGLDASWRGLSLTMPLKEEARRIARVLDPVAEESGVVNTLFRIAGTGSSSAWAGFNTDVAGLASAIRFEGLDATRTIVFGAGATAVSAVLAARSLGAEQVTVLARRIDAAAALAERFDGSAGPRDEHSVGTAYAAGAVPADTVQADAPLAGPAQSGTPITVTSGQLFGANEPSIAEATLIISTLPGHGIDWRDVPYVGLAPTFDVAYDPWPSPLAELTRAAGAPVYAGVGMLIEQALLQIRIFVNGDPGLPLEREDVLRESMRKAAGL